MTPSWIFQRLGHIAVRNATDMRFMAIESGDEAFAADLNALDSPEQPIAHYGQDDAPHQDPEDTTTFEYDDVTITLDEPVYSDWWLECYPYVMLMATTDLPVIYRIEGRSATKCDIRCNGRIIETRYNYLLVCRDSGEYDVYKFDGGLTLRVADVYYCQPTRNKAPQ